MQCKVLRFSGDLKEILFHLAKGVESEKTQIFEVGNHIKCRELIGELTI